MAKQIYTTGQILTAAQMTTLQANDYNQTVSAKTASYTLVAADAGTRITMNSASTSTVTVNTAIFAAGDTLEITNIGAGVCTVTAGTATVSTSSTLALKQFDSGQLYFSSTGVAIFFASDAADSAAFIGCRVTKTANQTISNNTATNLTFPSETYDTDAFHSTSVNTSRLTIPAGFAGYYAVTANVGFDTNAVGRRIASIKLNGSPAMAVCEITPGAGVYPAFSINTTFNLIVGDFVELEVFQTSGGNLDVLLQTERTFFQLQRVGS